MRTDIWRLAQIMPYTHVPVDVPKFDLWVQSPSPLSASYALWNKRHKALGGVFVEWLRYYGLVHYDNPDVISCTLLLSLLGNDEEVIRTVNVGGVVERQWIGEIDTLRSQSQIEPYIAGSILKQSIGYLISFYTDQRWKDTVRTSIEFNYPTCPVCLDKLVVRNDVFQCTKGHSLGYRLMGRIDQWDAKEYLVRA